MAIAVRAVAATLAAASGAVGGGWLLARWAAGDEVFLAHPVVVFVLWAGLGAAAWGAKRFEPGGGWMALLALSLGLLLLTAALAVALRSAPFVQLTAALRMPILASFAGVLLAAATPTPARRTLSRGILVAATVGFASVLLLSAQQTVFGDFEPLFVVPEPWGPLWAALGVATVWCVTGSLLVVPAMLWWDVVRGRRDQTALAALSGLPLLLLILAVGLAVWRVGAEGMAASAYIATGFTAVVLSFGLPLSTRLAGAGSLSAALVDPSPLKTMTSDAPVAAPDVAPSLTRRERDVLELLACGLTNRQVAEQLVLSKRTVDAHARSVFTKLGVSGEGSPRVRAALIWERMTHDEEK